MRLVLSGYYGFDNVGDEAILYSIIQALREAHPTIEITVLSNKPEQTAREYGVKAINRWKLKTVAGAIRQADGVISGGGSLLQDETGNRSVIYYSAIMWLAKMFRKPYYVYAQGIGPLNKSSSRKIVRRTLSGSDYVSVRDQESKDLLMEIGLKKDIALVPDPVLGLKRMGADEKERITEGRFIAVSVREWPSEHNFKKELAHSLDGLVRSGYEIVFIPMHGEHDAQTSAEVIDHMEESATIAPHDGTIAQKVEWIAQSELLIGMRLHALIFAAVSDTPFIALSYDPKIDSFANLCQQPVAAHVNEKWEAATLTELTKKQLEEKDEAVRKMLEYTAEAKQQAKQTAVQICEKYV